MSPVLFTVRLSISTFIYPGSTARFATTSHLRSFLQSLPSRQPFFRNRYLTLWSRAGTGILDIAGGNGELSFELLNLSLIPCTVIDPRPLLLFRWQKRFKSGYYHLNELFNKYNYCSKEEAPRSSLAAPKHFPILFRDYLWDADVPLSEKRSIFENELKDARNLRWTEKGLVESAKTEAGPQLDDDQSSKDIDKEIERFEPIIIPSFEEVMATLEGASIVVGMHPDQAAGAIVDFALARKIPFALIPCCTYAKEFPKRRLKDGTPVKSYEQLVQFLVEKDPENIKTVAMPFEGKNICVYSIKYLK